MMSSWADLRSWAAALLICALCGAAGSSAGEPRRFGYGTPATPEQIAGWNIDVRGDGSGLPDGKGTVAQGEEIYVQQCAPCHGTFGEGESRYPKLAGGEGTLTSDRPEPTVGSYWPFAPTLWDYINRAMPFQAPRSLSAEEVYALTAYVLNLNNIVPNDFVADRNSLRKIKMPSHDRFIWQDPRPDTTAEACMKKCQRSEEVKIISSAEGTELTPRTTGPLDEMLPK